MTEKRSRSGYILPVALLILSCTMMWGSAFLLTVSDQYAASNDMIYREQSRLMARSGWNLALSQLEETGSLTPLYIEKNSGQVCAELAQQEENLISIQVSAESKGYPANTEGSVRLLEVPWIETAEWPLAESMQNLQQASLFCTADTQVLLEGIFTQSLAVSSVNNNPVKAEVSGSAACRELYVNGNLQIHEDASLTADAIYVSGEISGEERIVCDRIFEQYTSGTDYRVLPVSRAM